MLLGLNNGVKINIIELDTMDKEMLEIIGRILEVLKNGGKVLYCMDDFGGLIRVLREEDAIFNLTFLMGCDLIEKEYDGILPHWEGKFPEGYDYVSFLSEGTWVYQYALPRIASQSK